MAVNEVQVIAALSEGLKKRGVPVKELFSEPVEGTKMRRFYVIAGKFSSMTFTERQTVLWSILNEQPADVRAMVSLVTPLTPNEVGVLAAGPRPRRSDRSTGTAREAARKTTSTVIGKKAPVRPAKKHRHAS